MRIYERKNILERNINYSNAYGRNLLQEAIISCENAIAVDLVNKKALILIIKIKWDGLLYISVRNTTI